MCVNRNEVVSREGCLCMRRCPPYSSSLGLALILSHTGCHITTVQQMTLVTIRAGCLWCYC